MLNKNESNERTNEFGQYEYKVQEKVTTKKIEHDLLHSNKHYFRLFWALIPFFAFFDGILICMFFEFWDNSTGSLIYFIFLGSVCATTTIILIAASIYKLYMLLWGYKKFCVAIDHFKGIKTVVRYRRRRHAFVHRYLLFNKYGKVEFVHELEYYTWSENYRMFGDGIEQSVHIGDRFFLIMRGKKIMYFYNDRMFDLSETLKKARVIGETPQPTLNGESADNGIDQNGDSGEERIFH